MAVYLVQHGQSYTKEEDPGRGLNPQGKADVRRIAAVAAGYGIKVSAIYHSGKWRAEQTAQIFSETLCPQRGIRTRSGLAPLDDVRPLAQDLFTQDNIMYVGHLPFMQKLLSLLITGSEENLVFQFQNGGIVCVDFSASGHWFIKWTLMPKID